MRVALKARAGRRSRRWLAFAAVIIPLAVLLVLQLRTLTRLQETSAAAHLLALKGYGRTVLRTAEAFYRQKAENALQVPVGLLDAEQRQALASHFATRDPRGVKSFFVIPFDDGEDAAPLFFAPDGRALDVPPEEPSARAARVASAPWRVTAQEGTPLGSAAPVVDERDPDTRVILRPIVDRYARVRGVAGMVLDSAYFRERYVPELIAAERGLVPEPLRDQIAVSIGRRQDTPVNAPSSAAVDAPFRFVFTDTTLLVRNTSTTPEQWARWNFLVDVALSLMLGALLLAAVLLALRSAARATRLSQMKTEFVSRVSHELRTPLASIRVFGEFMRLGRVKDTAKICEYGEYIEAESRRLTQLVDNILDFAKIESGQKRYRFEAADLGAIVADTLKAFEVRLRQDGFAVDLRTPPAPLPPAWVDPPAVSQVLTNLLDNALKYSGAARRIGVVLGQRNGFVTVAVSDHGAGIEVDEQERIFERFYRVRNGLVHDANGSGLGLAIVKHIVEAHRGRVMVESRPGAGSTFTIELPTHAA
ncbi:MAG: sensor histidine kinase [Candidatus Binatia bacterium]